MKSENRNDNNWCQSVGGIVRKNNQVLLVRHTYGAGKGRLIIPGGYVKWGETPQAAVQREVFEETMVAAVPTSLAGIRFNMKDWYAVFIMEYESGIPKSDRDENSEALFMDLKTVLQSSEVPDLTKVLLRGAMNESKNAYQKIPYHSIEKNGEYSLYALKG